MAVTLTHDCPHCGTANAGFTHMADYPEPNENFLWHLFFVCNTCHKPLIYSCHMPGYQREQSFGRVSALQSGVPQIYPRAAPAEAPQHTPENISRAFIQAEEAIRRQHWEAATAMDRRALEIATKEMAPSKTNESLYKRIEHLESEGKLTPSLKEWAHSLRLLGNEALHEIEGVEPEEARQAHELTRFILIYLYTLPTQVERAKAEENGSE